jgi:hypothetical protein
MNTVRVFAIAVLVLFAAGSLSAAPVNVVFVDGTVQVQSGSTWKNLDLDDKFDSALSVKLAAGALLEIQAQGGASSVTIAAPGVYKVDTLFKPRTEPSAVATVAGKLEKLAKGGRQDSTVAGVRGSEAVVGKGTMWVGDTREADETFESADKASKQADHIQAWKLYMKSLELYIEASDPTGAAWAAYSASLEALASNSGAKALSSLRAASPEDAGALRGSYALALATLSARYGAMDDAKTLLNKAINAGWFDDPTSLADAKSLLAGL